jgi:nicotinate-nucleotide pyrophosphorylase (carboxylating)
LAERAAPPSIEHELPNLEHDAARVAAAALAEDGERDVTTEVTGLGQAACTAVVEARAACTLAGLLYAGAVARAAGATVVWDCRDGDPVLEGTAFGQMRGSLAAVLRAERAMLNLLQRASGIATRTRRFVNAVQGTGCRILHTRKTAPGLRAFDIRAVLAGGGTMNRGGLSRTVMFKDNHWQALARTGAGVADAVRAARERGLFCIVEVESRDQVERAAAARADRLLIDNQPPQTAGEWAAAARRSAPSIEVEASGGITLENVRAYAVAGLDFVSVGALTHSVRAADIAIELE